MLCVLQLAGFEILAILLENLFAKQLKRNGPIKKVGDTPVVCEVRHWRKITLCFPPEFSRTRTEASHQDCAFI